MKKQFKQNIYFLIVSIFFTITSFAADGDPDALPESFPGDTTDVPIDNWIPFMVVLAIGLVFYYTSKRKTITE